MLEGFASLVGVISNVMYSYLLIIMLLAVGLYFTCLLYTSPSPRDTR